VKVKRERFATAVGLLVQRRDCQTSTLDEGVVALEHPTETRSEARLN